MRTLKIYLLLGVILTISSFASGGEFDLQIVNGGVWFSRNNVRISVDNGTKFDMLGLAGKEANPYFRVYVTYDLNAQQALHLILAPLKVNRTEPLNNLLQMPA